MDIDFDPRRPKNCPLQRSPLRFCPHTKIPRQNFVSREIRVRDKTKNSNSSG